MAVSGAIGAECAQHHNLMQVAIGKVVAGKVVVDGLDLVEGPLVTVWIRDLEAPVDLTPQEEAALLEAMAQAERGETISPEELYARLERVA